MQRCRHQRSHSSSRGIRLPKKKQRNHLKIICYFYWVCQIFNPSFHNLKHAYINVYHRTLHQRTLHFTHTHKYISGNRFKDNVYTVFSVRCNPKNLILFRRNSSSKTLKAQNTSNCYSSCRLFAIHSPHHPLKYHHFLTCTISDVPPFHMRSTFDKIYHLIKIVSSF